MSLEPPPPALQIKLLSPSARAPTRGSAFSAGYDLYASQDAVVPRRGKVLIETDISIAVPAETCTFLPFESTIGQKERSMLMRDTDGRVAPRSGLAAKHSIDVGAGVIDADYRGPLKVLLFNLGEEDFAVKAGDRVAQLIIERVSLISGRLVLGRQLTQVQIYTPEVVVVEQLPDSVRGAGGFGSTGGFNSVLPGVNLPSINAAAANGA